MAKYNRTVIGSVVKGQDGNSDYIQVSEDVVLKKGSYLNLENEKSQVTGLEEAVSNNKMSSEVGDKRIAQTEEFWNRVIETKRGPVKRKDMIRFQIVKIEKQG